MEVDRVMHAGARLICCKLSGSQHQAEGRQILAQHFSAGYPGAEGTSPTRDERLCSHFTRSLSPLRGLDAFVDGFPSDESLGYSQSSLRDGTHSHQSRQEREMRLARTHNDKTLSSLCPAAMLRVHVMMSSRLLPSLLLSFALAGHAAQAPVRKSSQVPPLGIPIPPTERAVLESSVTTLGREIETLRTTLKSKPLLLELLPDVQIYYNAVAYSLAQDTFYRAADFKTARTLLQHGMERVKQLRADQAPWNIATGLVVRGYVSRIDGSVQPYGLVVPPSYRAGSGQKHRLDFWFHGRGDNLTELAFIAGRETRAGEFTPDDTFVLHPYGRYCNAFKFAGEVDVFEALEHARKYYAIDPDRIAARGFSMGGAAAWHIGAHHASQWVAVNPGAGFVDVKKYQKLEDKLNTVPWQEQKLWNLYDALACPINLMNTTLVAYSGEEDTQKIAAEYMEQALAAEGFKMTHIIGPQTGHKYEPEAKKKVAALMDAAAAKGVNHRPSKISFVTYTLKYNRMHWVTVDALERHWEQARVDAELLPGVIQVKAVNVAALTLENPAPTPTAALKLRLNGQDVSVANASWPLHLRKAGAAWQVMDEAAFRASASTLAKRHDLQGPIDDAFMDRFVFVRPTGTALNEKVGAWVKDELADATLQWWRQFRGKPQIKDDTAVTDADIADSNLVLWGDPSSNKVLARIADKLPMRWDTKQVSLGGITFDADKHVLVLIYPNPLNPKRYVVLNSGFTFAETRGQSNAQQTPKLPDWAIVNLTVPRATRLLQGVVTAGFFDESWQVAKSVQ